MEETPRLGKIARRNMKADRKKVRDVATAGKLSRLKAPHSRLARAMLFTAIATLSLESRVALGQQNQGAPAPAVEDSQRVPHMGFYFRVGVGTNYLSFTGSDPIGRSWTAGPGISLLVAVGADVAPGLALALVGQSAIGFTNSSDLYGASGEQVQAFLGGLGLLVDWYPSRAAGWHVGASLAIGNLLLNAGESALMAHDASASILGGYDWWVNRHSLFGLFLEATGGTRAKMRFGDGSESGFAFEAGCLAIEGSYAFN